MRSLNSDNWSIKWSNNTAVIYCPVVGTNLIYSKEQIEETLNDGGSIYVPTKVLERALTELSAHHQDMPLAA
ncbi:MAG: hypothetical protein CBB87_03870 [Micavibrio sp. TMED27]|nr:hypothetical protein [Micavibrio sp.]OUT91959.1 MAG: hypothetical protein CBB87_03870 [Micavibrio sp. TMED27]|tara:strand:+ start:548 stop:763 length:216 start_codon:yes stop_codon:yes gene_type:complete